MIFLESFPDDARASHCPFVLTSFTGWSSKRCPGIGFLSRGDREIGVLRNVEPPMRPRLECRRETGLFLRCDRKVGNLHRVLLKLFRYPVGRGATACFFNVTLASEGSAPEALAEQNCVPRATTICYD